MIELNVANPASKKATLNERATVGGREGEGGGRRGRGRWGGEGLDTHLCNVTVKEVSLYCLSKPSSARNCW
jgi:hypothetical protein